MGDDQGLGVDGGGVAAGGIAHMADGCGAGKGLEVPVVEYIGHQSRALVEVELSLIHRGDAGSLLPPVLEGIQGSIDAVGGGKLAALLQGNAEYAALLAVLPG